MPEVMFKKCQCCMSVLLIYAYFGSKIHVRNSPVAMWNLQALGHAIDDISLNVNTNQQKINDVLKFEI